jgi:hypothetical protein
VRTGGPAPNLPSQIRAAVAATDPQLPVARFRTVEELRGRYTGSQRYMAGLFSILAGLALLLAAIGLYGLISQTITQRRHELGIRLALGATAGQTIRGVMRPGLILAAKPTRQPLESWRRFCSWSRSWQASRLHCEFSAWIPRRRYAASSSSMYTLARA